MFRVNLAREYAINDGKNLKRAARMRGLVEIRRQPIASPCPLSSRWSTMAQRKSSGSRKYGKAAGKSVKSAMHREKKGTLKSGRGGKGGTVKSRKQAIAIGLSEARKKGAKVPRKKAS